MQTFLDEDGPIAIAHRGGSGPAPENSMAAFANAVGLGYRYLETDVHATADGVLVALHDDTLDRVADRPGAVADLPWREVRAARIGGTEPVPRFADILGSWPDARVVVDAKSDAAVDPLIEDIRRTGAVDRVCAGSFSDERLRRLRAALGPRLCTSMGPAEVRRLRYASWGRVPAVATRRALRGPACAQIPARAGRIELAERRLLGLAHRLGLPVHVWTVNDPAEMRRLLDLGVDGLVTDEVATLRSVLQERGQWRAA